MYWYSQNDFSVFLARSRSYERNREAKPNRELYVRLYSSGTHQQMQKHLQSEDVILPYRAAVLMMAADRPR